VSDHTCARYRPILSLAANCSVGFCCVVKSGAVTESTRGPSVSGLTIATASISIRGLPDVATLRIVMVCGPSSFHVYLNTRARHFGGGGVGVYPVRLRDPIDVDVHLASAARLGATITAVRPVNVILAVAPLRVVYFTVRAYAWYAAVPPEYQPPVR